LFQNAVKLYVYPYKDRSSGEIGTADTIRFASPLQQLHALLLESHRVEPLDPLASHGRRQRHADAEPHPALRANRHRPTQGVHALADADQTATWPRSPMARWQPAPVVSDLEPELAARARERHAHLPRPRMTRDVSEGLLRNAVERGLDLGR
jgi:hypothetical protein